MINQIAPGTYLITGATAGIGAAIAKSLKRSGAQVIGTYFSAKTEAEEAIKTGLLDDCVHVDFSSSQGVRGAVRELQARGPYAGLVNNAAMIDFATWDEFDLTAWRRVFEVNVTAPVALVHGLKDHFEAPAAIVNIASTDGLTGTFASMAYSASKAALINATRSLGNVFGPRNIRVNAVAPGWVDTGMSTEASLAAAQQTPLSRNGKPEDIAEIVLFLLSARTSFVTGATWIVDGGYTNVDPIMLAELHDL